MLEAELLPLVERGCRRALVELNRDKWSSLSGCFDRRYWGWKLTDFPEASFQRLVLPLVWFERRLTDETLRASIRESVVSALIYTARIQHRDGSFDQAFPYERSWGATAFLLHPLVEAFRAVRAELSDEQGGAIERMCMRAAGFLVRRNETHGRITNHVAGAVQGLLSASDLLGDPKFARRADQLLEQILASQSSEGWFSEYGGADPGYHSLCVYYLAWVAERNQRVDLQDALRRATEFATWFVHPDGTYGGEYGSRRTSVFYPGGFAMLARSSPRAARLVDAATRAARAGLSPGPDLIDIGNLAPLLTNYCALIDALPPTSEPGDALPSERAHAGADFPAAGLYVRSCARRHVVFGASNGGVLFVYEKPSGRLLAADAGYVAVNGRVALTSQSTNRTTTLSVTEDTLVVRAPFVKLSEPHPTPASYLLLRIFNLTLGRSVALGNAMKAALVRILVRGGTRSSGFLLREVSIHGGEVHVKDRIEGLPKGRWVLAAGQRFSSIHMASARYFIDRLGGESRVTLTTESSSTAVNWNA